ncbi:hypothetical protein [Cetobacterium sp.]|uniref:hypothetical protein n=1 Tax=Cetobacterium sp. TaxID=2071632 RepID=UPI003EE81492
MSKNLKSCHKLFFVVLFSFLFSLIFGGGNTPNLSDKIAPELERIEAMPRRVKPAELNIEVTKIKSEPLDEAYIDRKNKNIYVDFSKKRDKNLKGVLETEELEKKYKIFITEKIKSVSEIKRKRKENIENVEKRIDYSLTKFRNKEMIKITYEKEPIKLYISVVDKSNWNIIKIYSLDIQNLPNMSREIIEKKEVTISYLKYDKNDRWAGFDIDGNSIEENVEVKKHGFTKGFIDGFQYECNSLPGRDSHTGIHDIKVSGPTIKTIRYDYNGSETRVQKYFDVIITTYDDVMMVLRYYCKEEKGDPIFHVLFQSEKVPEPGSNYRFYITHTKDGQVKEHILNIGDIYEKEEKEVTVYLNGLNKEEVIFNNQGIPSDDLITVKKQNFSDGFITGFQRDDCFTTSEHEIEIDAENLNTIYNIGHASDEKGKYTRYDVVTLKNGAYNTYSLKFYCNGEYISLRPNLTSSTADRIYIIHKKRGKVKKHTLNIYSNVPKIDRVLHLKNYEIIDNENLEEDILKKINFGTLEMKKTGTDLSFFPSLALGERKGENGWEIENSILKPRALIFTTFESKYQVPVKIKMYFLNEMGIPSLIQRGNPPTFLGAIGNVTMKDISANLYGELQKDEKFLNILEEFRQSSESELILSSKEDEQINFIVGKYISGKYNVPTEESMDISVVKEKYPSIVIKKSPIEKENIKLNINDEFDLNNEIQFSDKVINIPGVNIQSDKNIFLKSLWYQGFFTLDNGEYKDITKDGNSLKYTKVIRDKELNNEIELEIQYINRYPKIKILRATGTGEYNLNIKHYNFGQIVGKNTRFIKEVRKDFNLTINYTGKVTKKDFEITSSLPEIIIREDGTIEMPDMWISIDQTPDSNEIFPVIAINDKSKWEMETEADFNPVNNRPLASFDIGEQKNIKVPVNIRETPYQGVEKFFIYDRGALTERNLAVGGYTKELGGGSKNIVKVNFEMNLSEDTIKKMISYAKTKDEAKVEIPYSATEIHEIYGIKGVQDLKTKRFKILLQNRIETIKFPKVYVIKSDDIKRNSVDLNFKNPVSRSYGDLLGTFDVDSNGEKYPNLMLPNIKHPPSLLISNISSNWKGFTLIPSIHKIDVFLNNTKVKEITTDLNGKLRDEVKIESNGRTYSILGGKNSLIGTGIRNWDLESSGEIDTIDFKHYNSYNRVTAIDRYNFSLTPFNPRVYLNEGESTVLKKLISGTKTIKSSGKLNETRISLGTLKLHNYGKEITKSSKDNIGIRIEVPEREITSTSGGIIGKFRFGVDNTHIGNSGEGEDLSFVVTSGNIAQNVEYEFKVDIKIKVDTINGEKKDVIIDTVRLRWEELTEGDMRVMAYSSTLKDLEVDDDSTSKEEGFNVLGMLSISQYSASLEKQSNVIPAIAIGPKERWETKDYKLIENNVEEKRGLSLKVEYLLPGGKTITTMPSLYDIKVESGDNKPTYLYSQTVMDESESNPKERIITAAAFTHAPNQSGKEKISARLNMYIYLNMFRELRDIARNTPGDRVAFKAAPGNSNKIALIHGRNTRSTTNCRLYLPTDYPDKDKVITYIDFPDIVFVKRRVIKSAEYTFNEKYMGEKIVFSATTSIQPEGVKRNYYEEGALMLRKYGNTIRITLPDGTQIEKNTDKTGKVLIENLKLEKHSNSVNLNLDYTGQKVELHLSEIVGNDFYNITIEHLDPSGDVRRTYPLRLNIDRKSLDIVKGEMDLVISSRYNPLDGQLNSAPLVVTANGITYEKEVLDLKLLNGDYLVAPEGKNVSINGVDIPENTKDKEILLENKKIKIKVTRKDGSLQIKPIYWYNSVTDSFTLTYKESEKITNQYIINVKAPEFFVASSGILDFGKISKFGNPKDVTKVAPIDLEYNTGFVKATYTLDISRGEGNSTLENSLYLDDNRKLLVKDLSIEGEEILNPGLENDPLKNTKRRLNLKGTIHGESIKNTQPGEYEKTIQILIHIK